MNFTIKSTASLIAVTVCTIVTAQSTTLKEQNGYKVSKNFGSISLLNPQPTGLKNNEQSKTITNPTEKVLSKIKSKALRDNKNKFDFFGGEVYKGNSIPYASVTDKDGNTYITGGSSNENQPSGDFFTIKVGSDGQIIWQKREQAALYAVEHGTHIIFDNEGNIIISGLKWNGNDMDIRLVKYTSDGTKLFDTSFDNGTKGLEIPSHLTTDSNGNIYLSGITWSGNSVDYVTLKYNSNGEKLWHKTENPANREAWNEATAVAVDNNGNVIVTGYSPNTEGWLNYHTIKYTADGTKIWEQAYNYKSTDPENIADVTNSVPAAITTDADNNIYVTGTFDTYLNRIGTIKYNANGEEQWVQSHRSQDEQTNGWQIALHNNKLYVSGNHSGSFSDDGTVLLSYNTDGTENWATATNGLIQSDHNKLSFDTNGNIIIAANGMTPGAEAWEQDVAARAYKYSPEGNLLGESAFVISTTKGTATMGRMAGVGTDNNGNVYFSVNSFYTQNGNVFETVKSSFGNTVPEKQWSAKYANLGSSEAIMLNSFSDSKGSTFSTGSYYSYADEMLNMNYFLVKHKEDGTVAWNILYNSKNGNPADGIIGKADTNGNVYVGLIPSFEQSPPKLKLIKLSPEGSQIWVKEIDWSNSSAFVLTPLEDGSLYFSGRSGNSIVGIKYNSDGTEAWKTSVPGISGQVNTGNVNSNGQLTLTTRNFAAIQFNTNGTVNWSTTVSIPGQTITASDMHISKDGSIYINGNTAQDDMVIVKLDTAGKMQWYKTYGDQDRSERSYTIKSFSDGGVALVGYSLAINGDIHNVIQKYSADGELLWNVKSDNMRYYNDFHIDADDKVYILNQEIIDPSAHKIVSVFFPVGALLTFDKNGENKNEEYFIGPEYSEFYGRRLVPNSNNKLLVAGTVADQSFYRGLYFFETEHKSTLGLSDNLPIDSKSDGLGQNYPNPVSSITTIPFTLTNGGKAVINLYNIQGQYITKIADGNYPAGKNNVTFEIKSLVPGIYFYTLESKDFKQTKKMIVK